jgi:hypothetical protein
MSDSVQELMASDTSSLLYKMATEDEYLIPLKRFKERRLYANLKRDLVVPLGTAAFLPKVQVQFLRQKYQLQTGFVYVIDTSLSSSSSSSSDSSSMCNSIISSDEATTVTDTTTTNNNNNNTSSSNNNNDNNNNNNNIDTSSNNNHNLIHSLPLITTLTLSSSLSSTDIANEPYLIDMITSLDALGWQKYIVNFPSWIPLAHNKLCALKRQPTWLYEQWLGFSEGQFVMEHAANWIVT